MALDRLLTLIANLLPVAGVLWWGWDVFEILVLFWMQTVLVVGFAALRITKLPASALGDITVNGVKRRATHRDLVLGVGGFGLVFCAGHLMFLWVIFSGHWSEIIHGPASFVQQLIIASGAWTALAVGSIGEIISFLLTPPYPAPVAWLATRVGVKPATKNRDDLGLILLALLKRAFLLQAAIIFGGMLANRYGSMAPLMILIGLKTLFELGRSKPSDVAARIEIRT